MLSRILNLMKESRMTARELTERLGVNYSTISQWKSGKTKPSVEHVRKIAEIFQVTTDYIINGDGNNIYAATHNVDDMVMDQTMIDVYHRLSESRRGAVRDFFYQCLCEMEKKSEQSDTLELELKKSDFLSGQEEAAPTDEDNGFADFATFEAGLDKK